MHRLVTHISCSAFVLFFSLNRCISVCFCFHLTMGVVKPVAVAEWLAHLTAMRGGLPMESGILPLLKHACGEAVGWLATKRSTGVAPETNLRERISHMPPPSANKAAHSGFETERRRHQKSKKGVSMAPQKGLMSSKKF